MTLNQAGVKWTNEAPDKMPEGTAMAPPAVVIDGVGMGQTPAILIKLVRCMDWEARTPSRKCAACKPLKT